MKLPLKDKFWGNMNTNIRINHNLVCIKYIFCGRINFLMIALLVFWVRNIACSNVKASVSSINLAYISFSRHGVTIPFRAKKISKIICDLCRFRRFKNISNFQFEISGLSAFKNKKILT